MKKLIPLLAFGLSLHGATQAQYSPQQPFKGTIGKDLHSSTQGKTIYNKPAAPGAPNVIWILIDDAGFGATSAFGGLVETPNIERLANAGLRFTNFHTTAICSPTRAALLTGRNHHSAHMGMLTPAVLDFPGYDTRMPFEKATIAEVLRENGYNTFALGKWHLTPVAENSQAGPFNRWPTGRGFDHFYGFLPGATDQWHPELWEDQTKLDIEPNKTHLNELLADKAIKYIANQKSGNPEKPFFLYLATGATHAPHQVAKEWIDRYKGKFDEGWDVYREKVLANQKKLGIIPANATLPPRNPGIRPWDSLSAKEHQALAHFMEVYAAFYSYTDYEIGRIIDYLQQIDQLDNTLVMIVLGDNGASKAGTQYGTVNAPINNLKGEARIDAILQARDIIGSDQSSTDYPVGWAMAANTPFKYWKTDANAEGGTHNPLIIYYPRVIKEPGIRNQYGHVIDVLPTTLDLIHAQYPSVINGYKQDSVEGTSLAYAVNEPNAPNRHRTQYYEIMGSRAIYKDGWKAGVWHQHGSPFENDVWELYDIKNDFNEQTDLAAKQPEKLKEMIAAFDTEARKYHVYPLKDGSQIRLAEGRSVYNYTTGITLFPGVDNLVGVNAPLYNGRSFNVDVYADIETGKEEGVLFAVGGDKSGISLFIKDGKFQYAHKAHGQVNTLVSQIDIPKGKVVFRLAYNREGTETIFINGQKAAERTFTKREAQIVSDKREDGTDVGRDLHTAVSDSYQAPFNFTGKIKKATITYLTTGPESAVDE
ncbi:MAG: arylsulfatase [Ilumatobacteraceae bacterium]